MTGSDIFSNDPGASVRFVDQFYACGLGRPAHELGVDGSYRAVYTAALLTALEGVDPLEPPDPDYVRSRPLRDYLAGKLSTREVDQAPEAIIASDPDAWISKLPAGVERRGRRPKRGRPLHPAADAARMIVNPYELRGKIARYEPEVSQRVEQEIAALKGPVRHPEEGLCSFMFRGANPTAAYTEPGGECEIRYHSAVAIDFDDQSARTVLVTFREGSGVVLPVLRGYDAKVDFDGGELVSVAYERRDDFASMRHMSEVREMRAIAAVASRDGRFTLAPETAESLVSRMREVKRIDPALAVYAAYAYAGIGRADLIRDMAGFVLSDIGGVLFDIEMLSRRPRPRRTIGHFPLLGQGWALLPALDVPLPPALQGIDRTVVPSLWTLFNAEGCEQLAAAISRGAL